MNRVLNAHLRVLNAGGWTECEDMTLSQLHELQRRGREGVLTNASFTSFLEVLRSSAPLGMGGVWAGGRAR